MSHDPFAPPSPDDSPSGPEPFNPYDAPEAELLPSARPPYHGTLPGQPFSASVVIGHAWETYKARFGLVFGLGILPPLLLVIYQLIGQAMTESIDPESIMAMLGQVAYSIAGMIIQLWMTCGQTRGLIAVARGEPAGIEEIFHGGPYVLRTLGASLLYVLVIAPVVLLILAPGGLLLYAGQIGLGVIALIVGIFVAVCVGLAIRVRFDPFLFLIVDRECGVIESLRYALVLTRGHTIDLMGLVLVGSLIGFSGILACGFGVVLTLPWMFLLFACTYVALLDEHPQIIEATAAVPNASAPDVEL